MKKFSLLPSLLVALLSVAKGEPRNLPIIESNGSDQGENSSIGVETINFFDGSNLKGNLISMDEKGILRWKHASSPAPLPFDYSGVDSVFFKRGQPVDFDQAQLTQLHLINGDFLRGNLIRMDRERIILSSVFSEHLEFPLAGIRRIDFLPPSFEILYDCSQGLKGWKTSNSKAWREDLGDLVSVFSGGAGTTLAEKEVIGVRFHAEWEKSFYLAIRFFSDSDGGNYGNVGYHLSFSNNRISLQANKLLNGKLMRETIGSKIIPEMMGIKKGSFSVHALRPEKEFVVAFNGREVARWKDSNKDFMPTENGILFVNQGGNSYLRLKELSITGWAGDSFPKSKSVPIKDANRSFITFVNGDSTFLNGSSATGDLLTLESAQGTFQVGRDRVRSMLFPTVAQASSIEPTEQILLHQSMGKLSFELFSVTGNQLSGQHPSFGEFAMPLQFIKSLQGNLLVKRNRKYLAQLKEARRALKMQKPENALRILSEAEPRQRGWYWSRLELLAKSYQSQELLSFSPDQILEAKLLNASYLGEPNEIITHTNDGTFTLWDGKDPIASFETDPRGGHWQEWGRGRNEFRKSVSITRPYWLGNTEVTQAQFENLTGQNPSVRKGENLPVTASWEDAILFCGKLNEKHPPPSGYEWRLPTEAEWEFACKGAIDGPYGARSETTLIRAEDYQNQLNKLGWYKDNSENRSNPVAQKKPNGSGLFDMHGNVWEWCLDSIQPGTGHGNGPRVGLRDPLEQLGAFKVSKGGSFKVKFDQCRSAVRQGRPRSSKNSDTGFRVALGPILSDPNPQPFVEPKASYFKGVKTLSLVRISAGSFVMGSPGLPSSSQLRKSPKTNQLIYGSPSGQLKQTDWLGEKTRTLHDFNASILHLRVTKDGIIAGGCKDGTLFMAKESQKESLRKWRGHAHEITALSVDRNGTRMVSSALDGFLKCHSLEDGSERWSKKRRVAEHIEFSPDGMRILCFAPHNPISVHDLKTGEEKTLIENAKGEWIKASWHPNGESVVCLSANGMIAFFAPSAKIFYKSVNLQLRRVNDFCLSPAGDEILVSTDSGQCFVKSFPVSENLYVIHEDGERETSEDYYFALAKEKLEPILPFSKFIKQFPDTGKSKIVRSPDDKWTLTCLDGALRLWRNGSETCFSILGEKLSSPYESCAFTPCGRYVVGKLSSGHLLVYPGKQEETIPSSGYFKKAIHGKTP